MSALWLRKRWIALKRLALKRHCHTLPLLA
jgi:hypothetical protein